MGGFRLLVRGGIVCATILMPIAVQVLARGLLWVMLTHERQLYEDIIEIGKQGKLTYTGGDPRQIKARTEVGHQF